MPNREARSEALAKRHGTNGQAKRALRNHLFQGSADFFSK